MKAFKILATGVSMVFLRMRAIAFVAVTPLEISVFEAMEWDALTVAFFREAWEDEPPSHCTR